MADLQIRGNKVALLDSNDNIIYTLPDSAGSIGEAVVTDGAGKLFYGGIDIESVLAAGDSSNRNITVNVLNSDIARGETINIANPSPAPPTPAYPVHGYVSGGESPTPTNTIDKFNTAVGYDTATFDVGDLTFARGKVSGKSSSTHGYTTGGTQPGPTTTSSNIIEKHTFVTDANSTDVGDLTQSRASTAGQSSSTHGYTSGGMPTIFPGTSQTGANPIDKFPFSVDANATDVGDLSQSRKEASGTNSSTHGYSSGGEFGLGSPSAVTTIDKFPFSSDTNATDVGDLILENSDTSGQSSTTHGYVTGGITGSTFSPPPLYRSDLQKFPFATDTNATKIGDLIASPGFYSDRRYGSAGVSSATHGYACGGSAGPVSGNIYKFPFATDADAPDTGMNLTQSRRVAAGTQG